MEPTSLLTAMILTIAVSSDTASFTCCKDTLPLASTGKYVTRYPNTCSICKHAFKIEECSTFVVTICFLPGCAKHTPLMAEEFASEEPEVKIMSSLFTPKSPAIALRAFSIIRLISLPSSYRDSLLT